jgi:hypothetical protein
MALESNLSLDLYFRRNMLGNISTAGHQIQKYEEVYTDFYEIIGNCNESAGFVDDGYDYCIASGGTATTYTLQPRVSESGKMNFNVYGVKVKYLF